MKKLNTSDRIYNILNAEIKNVVNFSIHEYYTPENVVSLFGLKRNLSDIFDMEVVEECTKVIFLKMAQS